MSRLTINGVPIHPSVTLDRVCDMAEQEMFGTENPGICISCGEDADGCEPDARQYKCESCGQHAVYGPAELLNYMV
jgi:predicted amidophosphoribosyltransferase